MDKYPVQKLLIAVFLKIFGKKEKIYFLSLCHWHILNQVFIL